VGVDPWTESVQALIAESPDLQTVQYLAGAALELESLGREDLVSATFRSLQEKFGDSDSAAGTEFNLAIDARQARQQVIGWTFQADYPAGDGRPLDIEDYRGRVVLMPFWAMSFPHSLTMLPQLKAIAEANADSVVLLGMNLDIEGAPVERFLETADLGFRSFRCASSPTEKVSNPMAARFGMVSMPFLAILDQKGRVAAIKLSARGVEEAVQRIVAAK
jgi:thiol-disulfide isomerase/thioredoxin